MSDAPRAAVALEARSWFGTPYHHHGRLKGVGVDCAQILLAVFCDALQLAPPLDVGNYSPQWHLHRGEEVYLDWLARAGARPLQTSAKQGDIAMFRFGRTYSHAAICVDDAGEGAQFIHAYVGRGVIFSRLTEDPFKGRDITFWSLFP